ncbi:hypothetical protein GCM10023215_45680 [Pseudonocardia yuanmonensis]|uniref:Carboxyltransferase domain-containing protein n=1 Tax=Pseudonocardia yuanmonensis TaxID=1095914 RepID=A0ABP8X7Z1_9PSEU
MGTWTAYRVRAGQQVSVGRARSGARSYLAVRGGIDTTPFLGSRSTYTAAGIGGLSGGPLVAGDALPIGAEVASPERPGAHIGAGLRQASGGRVTVRVVPGLGARPYEGQRLARQLARVSMTAQADRIGCRLDGPPLTFVESMSLPTVLPTIQRHGTGTH